MLIILFGQNVGQINPQQAEMSVQVFLICAVCLHNRTNPIGMRGHMAKCYGDLVQELWSGTQKNLAPLKLRVCPQTSLQLTPPNNTTDYQPKSTFFQPKK